MAARVHLLAILRLLAAGRPRTAKALLHNSSSAVRQTRQMIESS